MSAPVIARNGRPFNSEQYLLTCGARDACFRKREVIFAQSDPADAVFYIRKGKVKVAVVAKSGKEATIAILEKGDFFGEGCLVPQPARICSASALTECWLVRINKQIMVELLRKERGFSHMFLSYLLIRNIRYEEDLVDQLFNSSEKRLARILLLLSHLDEESGAEEKGLKISQETLAQMGGTTRSRVNFFMNQFRKSGFIEYRGGLHVHRSLMKVILYD